MVPEERRFDGHQDVVTSVAVLPGGRHALSGAWDTTLRLWDLNTGAELARLTFDARTINLAHSPEREPVIVVVAEARGYVHVIELIE